jgi:hypothetical protein
MPMIFSQLLTRVDEIRKGQLGNTVVSLETVAKDASSLPPSERLDELRDWLESLARGGAPRSIAAMALGMMQRAYETAHNSNLSDLLHKAWLDFSNQFISDVAKRTSPTRVHALVAKWALEGGADLISVNFDGLTHRALQELLDRSTEKGSSVVLSEPNEISGYFLGESLGSGPKLRLVPVIKIWGDVFHAVCTNRQCPQSGIRAPIFRLWEQFKGGDFDGAPCPDCRSQRQLQIFFAGYEEKERSALASMTELLKFIAPRIGCIVSIGFSGLWDQALVRFLASICADLDNERSWRSQISEDESAIELNSYSSCWINVDKDPKPPLFQELALFGVSPIPVCLSAEEFAKKAPAYEGFPGVEMQRYGGEAMLDEGKWETFAKERECCPASYELLEDAAMVQSPGYLQDCALLRQLGIKTRIALAADQSDSALEKEANHNRRRHSFGAAHLALLWFRKLVERGNINLSKGDVERFATVVMFSAVHHDIGHIPFTHLAEDILAEVHWSIQEWSSEFHHDASVLGDCFEDFRDEVFSLSDETAKALKAPPGEFRVWVESAIQGRSGLNWIDAIVNSPLDADKLDYVLRDCEYLRQGIHVPIDNNRNSYRWLDLLFSNTRLLPSGLLALEGTAGEHAREFLEERRWLYKNQYHQLGFRALERLAGGIVLHWLLQTVPHEITNRPDYQTYTSSMRSVLGDTSSLKGRTARKLLWGRLRKTTHPNNKLDRMKGEPELLMEICEELAGPSASLGLPSHPRLREWAKHCLLIFQSAFEQWRPQSSSELTLMQHLTKETGLTCSEVVYVPSSTLMKSKEIIREIETLYPFRALLDVVVEPRMLSYPDRRRFRFGPSQVIGECLAVAHKDPDRWGMPTNRWVPLSESIFAERDRNRWAKVMAVSVESDDPLVHHALDRFRNMCSQQSIPTREVDPGGDQG